ncbi:MAG: ABC transporter ATP-binding protein [Planctomycetota bacterium]
MSTLTAQPRPAALTSDPDHLIRCARLTKVFKDFWLRDRVTAVNGIDLDVRRGEVFGLLGPNGSGKSTTIKMILGLLHPTSGVVSVFGRPARDVAVKKQIGYLPEESYLYRFLNARETLEYYGKLFHQDRRKRRQRIDTLLEMVGLDKVQRRPVGEYSKGMQRRIGLAQALINDPRLLILDEPTTGLDPIGTRQIKDLILRLRDTGKTVLLCSHLLSDVEDVTDRAAIMFGGKVRRMGTIDELLAKQDQTTITTPTLAGLDSERIVAALEALGVTDVSVTQSRQRLEALFLDIVEQAQAEGATTSGAGNAGAVAAFLTEASGDAAGRSAAAAEDAGAVLERLTSSDPPPPEVAAPEADPPAADAEADGVLAGLTEPAAAPKPKPAPKRASAPPPPREADAEVLDDLLGGKS